VTSPIKGKWKNSEVKKALCSIENCLGAKQNREKEEISIFYIFSMKTSATTSCDISPYGHGVNRRAAKRKEVR
jgi:hypothetical protein